MLIISISRLPRLPTVSCFILFSTVIDQYCKYLCNLFLLKCSWRIVYSKFCYTFGCSVSWVYNVSLFLEFLFLPSNLLCVLWGTGKVYLIVCNPNWLVSIMQFLVLNFIPSSHTHTHTHIHVISHHVTSISYDKKHFTRVICRGYWMNWPSLSPF
jgi:hypothetical protein